MLKRKLAWSPQWVWVFVLVALIVAVILSLALQKRCTVVYGLSRGEISKFRTKKVIGWLGLVGGLGALGYSIAVLASGGDELFLSVLGASLLAIIGGAAFLSLAVPLRAVGYINGWFRVKGCSKEFLDSIGPA